MNALQLIRKARFELDAIRTDGSVSAMWSDEEAIDCLNTAVDAAYKMLRLSGSDLVTTIMRSTDSTVDLITESYTPSSLQIAGGTATYTLPPDCVGVKSILPVGTAYQGVTFRPSVLHGRLYQDYRTVPAADVPPIANDSAIFWYTLYGARTLQITPTPRDTFDIALAYYYRPLRLITYSAGTVGTGGVSSTSITGSGTDWVNVGLRVPAELITGSLTAPASLNTHYPRISAITSATALTTSKAQTISNGTAYRIAMVPLLPDEHHAWLAQRTAAEMLRKVSLPASAAASQALEAQLMSQVQPEVSQRQVQESLPIEMYEGWGQV